MKLPQNEWRGRFRIRKDERSPICLPWQWDSAKSPVLQRLERVYQASLDAADAVVTAKAELHKTNEKHKRYTPAGLADQLREYVGNDVTPKLSPMKAELERAKGDILTKRAQLKPKPASDPKDAAAAIRRAEIRSFLRSMTDDQRRTALMGRDANPEYIAAMLEAPAAESGVPNSSYKLLYDAAVKEQHGPLLEEIEHLEEAVQVAERALNAAALDIRNQAGTDPMADAA